ncbi:hypothetical protein [Pseudaestuariivita atlantica]|uniref:Uncharacterized protein n=1 Tax=Pseudaestuariivita atlantica TaxID=1317121 RepID=A0A0L1JRI7_9RHOB|nr:hypothetical protein [Pseudaestuariivita atlantica]KNG94351.1 hypothetical protein ATO11_09160 [Pseudaestuariivita atlantica]
MAHSATGSRSITDILHDVPADRRLAMLASLLVQELETLGYDLASEVSSTTVGSVFVMAKEMQDYADRVQALIDRDLQPGGAKLT